MRSIIEILTKREKKRSIVKFLHKKLHLLKHKNSNFSDYHISNSNNGILSLGNNRLSIINLSSLAHQLMITLCLFIIRNFIIIKKSKKNSFEMICG
ncbi:hypothetical protein DID74_00230 [Candidatus Marinamargulisbacteria bacterium SCGC AG-333-B06]|nr:hypothetical protein DID74_00230 [Candidatus Marinamargulisbacteria bacterium SCGC AG-333-B06]